MPHNGGTSIWQRTWCKSVECARIYPPLISVGVAPPPICLLLGKLCIPTVDKSEGEGFIHIQYLISHLSCGATTLQCLLLPLWPTQCWVCHIASLYQCLPSVLADMPLLLYPPCHLTTDLTMEGWKVACGLKWWSLHSIACLYCYSPMPPHHQSNPGSMEGGL